MTFDPNNFLILPVHPQYSQPLKESGSKGLSTLLEKIKNTISSILTWLSGEQIPELVTMNCESYKVSACWRDGKPMSATRSDLLSDSSSASGLAQREDQVMPLKTLTDEFQAKLLDLSSAISLTQDARLSQSKGTAITLTLNKARDLTQQVEALSKLAVKITHATSVLGTSRPEAASARILLNALNRLRRGILKDLKSKSIIYSQ